MGIGPGTGRGGARKNSGGARPNSGPKKKDPLIVPGLPKGDPRAFLVGVMDNETLDLKERVAAAKAVATMDRTKNVGRPPGKKEVLKSEAEALTQGGQTEAPTGDEGAFIAGKPPTLKRVA